MSLPPKADAVWARLAAAPVDSREAERFDPKTLEALPAPAARWLKRVIPTGVLLADTVELSMSGEIKLGPRWFPFTAQQILRSGVGFVWKPVVGRRLVRFTGADLLGPGGARMEFRLLGIIPVVTAEGPDVARSAAGRLAAETVVWLPQATTPQGGARWTAIDDRSATVTLRTDGTDIDITIGVDDDGRLRSVEFQRWNGSADPPALEPFGGDLTEEFEAADGVLVSGSGAVGWGYGTPAWGDGEFFRYRITGVDWVEDVGVSRCL